MAKKKQQNVQQHLSAELEPPRIERIDVTAADYYAARLEFQSASSAVKTCKERLIDAMHEAGLKTYRTKTDLVVTLTPKDEQLKVKREDDD